MILDKVDDSRTQAAFARVSSSLGASGESRRTASRRPVDILSAVVQQSATPLAAQT